MNLRSSPPLDEILILRRRELVRGCLARGQRAIDIIEYLTKKKGFFPQTFTDKQKLGIVQKDIEAINKDNRQEYTVAKEDNDNAMVEYLERTHMLYTKAIQDTDYTLARELSKDLARAKGVPVDEVVRVEADTTKMMRQMFQALRSPKEISSPVVTIEVIPEKTEASPVEQLDNSDGENDRDLPSRLLSEERELDLDEDKLPASPNR